MTIHGTGSRISLGEIRAEFNKPNLGQLRSAVWYLDGVITTGNFTSTSLKFSDFYNKRATDPVTPGTYDVPAGTDITWTVPLYRHNIIVQIWGGGGRGGAYGKPGSSNADGTRSPSGGNSIFAGMTAYGGQGGQNAGTDRYGGIATGSGGAGGGASGGDLNVSGGAGADGAGDGGQSYAGTTWIDSGSSFYSGGNMGQSRIGGSYYPGGGGNGYVGNSNGKFPGYPAAAGAGGYSQKTYSIGDLAAGSGVHVLCGLAGAPQTYGYGQGYPGQNGRVLIQWN